MITESESAEESAEVCPICGRPRKEHSDLIRGDEVYGPRDCDYALELLKVESDVVLPILAMLGIGRADVGRERLREMAELVWKWRAQIA